MGKEHSGEDTAARLRRLMAMDKGKLPPDGGEEFNRLIFATSPYLLQHAENPVDWYEWGEEAFAKARIEDKPVFLSIGYATCHWCHVMAHESFADDEVAAVLNASFVGIKVDREERPDIDDHYMAVAQLMSGSGGWPLTIFMTPEKRPFFATTYVPRTQRMGMPGIIQLLERVTELWRTDREKLEESAAAAIEALGRLSVPKEGSLPGTDLAENACRQLTEMYDGFWGGFGSAPKFPMTVYLGFLLRHWKRSGNEAALAMVEQTLRLMRQGGICDQLGFGFHRYAVDREWLVPHFEKMLYDQALIAAVSLETFQVAGSPYYLELAEEIFAYVLRELSAPEGGFYAGQDADTEGEEGRYYLWSPDEVLAVLGGEEGAVFCRLFDVTGPGNFEGRNILHLLVPPETFAAREGILPGVLRADVERWRQKLLAEREGRVRPFRDEKVLTAWNGLMVAALAKGYAVTGAESYLAAAARAVTFIVEKLCTPKGRLLRSFHLGKGSIPAFLEDYAFIIWGIIELHQVTLEPAFLDGARTLAGEMLRLFGAGGEGGGGLYETGNDGEQLPIRRKSAYDGALPSGNGVAALALLRLGRIAADERLLAAGEAIVHGFMGEVSRQPLASLNLLAACDYLLGPEVTVTLAGQKETLGELLRTVHRRFIPGLVLRHGGAGEGGDYPAVEGRPTAYVCAAGACRPPVTEAEALGAVLDALG
ncbi:MAG TPA: thioredoxin domain-containing protein [Geobacteraceae bacterium]